MIITLLSVLLLIPPLCSLVLGFLCWRCAPESPTWALGYRSRRARASDESWRFAQNLAGQIWFWLGLSMLILSVVLCMQMDPETMESNVRIAFYGAVSETVLIFLSVLPTEIVLRQKFSRMGRPLAPKERKTK